MINMLPKIQPHQNLTAPIVCSELIVNVILDYSKTVILVDAAAFSIFVELIALLKLEGRR